MAMESSVLVQPKRPDWHKHEQMQIHHSKSMSFLILNESLQKWIKLVARHFSPNGKKNNELIHLGWAFRVCLTRSSCKVTGSRREEITWKFRSLLFIPWRQDSPPCCCFCCFLQSGHFFFFFILFLPYPIPTLWLSGPEVSYHHHRQDTGAGTTPENGSRGQSMWNARHFLFRLALQATGWLRLGGWGR